MLTKDNLTQTLNAFPTIKYLEDKFATKADFNDATNKILTAIDRVYRVVKRIEARTTKFETSLA